MDVKLLKHTAIYSVVLMLVVVVISIGISQSNQSTIYADGAVKQENGANDGNGTNNNPDSDTAKDVDVSQQLGDKYIILKKSSNTQEHIEIEDLYMDRSIRVTISGTDRQTFDDSAIIRINQGEEYKNKPVIEDSESMEETSDTDDTAGEASESNETKEAKETSQQYETVNSDERINSDEISDPVLEYSISYTDDANNSLYTAVIDISLDTIYAYIVYQDEENIYIDLRHPKEFYKKIIVVDAGHGGTDCGTFSEGALYYEKDINLSILLYLKDILDQEDIKVYYTRTTDKTVYLNPRVNLANAVDADYFISIHCNANESPQPNGAEVLYYEYAGSGLSKSKQFAQICLDEIANITQRVHRGLVNGNDIVIIKKAKMPVALIEIGYMSNQEDMSFLLQEDNRKKIAGGIYRAIQSVYSQ